jgi:hypothetical protein
MPEFLGIKINNLVESQEGGSRRQYSYISFFLYIQAVLEKNGIDCMKVALEVDIYLSCTARIT